MAKKQRKTQLTENLRYLATLAGMALVILVARASLADHYVVPSGSMEPTVRVGDRILVDKRAFGLRVPGTETWVKGWGAPQPGDVVVLSSPDDGEVLLKRLVAGPGDQVVVREGRVHRSPSRATTARQEEATPESEATRESLRAGEEHRLSLSWGGGPDWGPRELGPDEYLLMGDNRGNSHDGRAFGLVSRDRILGRALGVYLREGRFTWLRL